MAKLIAGRLAQPDCEFNGWILDGFPMTSHQLEFLYRTGLYPRYVMFRDFGRDEMMARRTC